GRWWPSWSRRSTSRAQRVLPIRGRHRWVSPPRDALHGRPGRRESAQGSATLSCDGPAGVTRSQLVEGVLPSLLRQVDPTAEIVELTLDPDGLSYTVQLRTQGETSKPRISRWASWRWRGMDTRWRSERSGRS